MRSLLLAGVQSGCGKTTITLALMQFFIKQGLNVRGFKSGPDFLDPLWHSKLTGTHSYNLDTKMVGIAESQQLILSAQQQNTDLAIIEGVMGLFDGRQGVGQDGSSAYLAKVLNIDIWLVVDVRGMSGSVVPLVAGFVDYAQKLGINISGIIANRVGSPHHAQLIKELLIDNQLPPLLAWLDKQAPKLPERHLGLIKPDEFPLPDFSNNLHIEVDNLPTLLPKYKHKWTSPPVKKYRGLLKNQIIAIAKDEACCFIYPANIDWLQEQGANLVYFFPILGEPVPTDSDAIWLPGGYPELYAEKLSKSDTWSSLRSFIKTGKPLLAECGGMMLLGQTITDQQEKVWDMAGVLPITTTMQDKLAALGYRECINGSNAGVKGHEFHHSIRTELEKIDEAFLVVRGDNGIQQENIRASYIHWYFASAPDVVSLWFLE